MMSRRRAPAGHTNMRLLLTASRLADTSLPLDSDMRGLSPDIYAMPIEP